MSLSGLNFYKQRINSNMSQSGSTSLTLDKEGQPLLSGKKVKVFIDVTLCQPFQRVKQNRRKAERATCTQIPQPRPLQRTAPEQSCCSLAPTGSTAGHFSNILSCLKYKRRHDEYWALYTTDKSLHTPSETNEWWYVDLLNLGKFNKLLNLNKTKLN